MNNVTVVKDVAETIYLYSNDTSYGMFCFNSKGDLFINSDWGYYCYAWRHYGEKSFKDFLKSLTTDYLVGKLAINYNNQQSSAKHWLKGAKLEGIKGLVDLFIKELNKDEK